MTIWTRVVYCEPSVQGDVFTLLERAQGSQAIRRLAGKCLNEADARRALAAMGETGPDIDAMIAHARDQRRSGRRERPRRDRVPEGEAVPGVLLGPERVGR